MGHPGLRAIQMTCSPTLVWSGPRGSLGVGGRWGPFGQEEGWSSVTRPAPFAPGCLICGSRACKDHLEKRLLCAGRAFRGSSDASPASPPARQGSLWDRGGIMELLDLPVKQVP